MRIEHAIYRGYYDSTSGNGWVERTLLRSDDDAPLAGADLAGTGMYPNSLQDLLFTPARWPALTYDAAADNVVFDRAEYPNAVLIAELSQTTRTWHGLELPLRHNPDATPNTQG